MNFPFTTDLARTTFYFSHMRCVIPHSIFNHPVVLSWTTEIRANGWLCWLLVCVKTCVFLTGGQFLSFLLSLVQRKFENAAVRETKTFLAESDSWEQDSVVRALRLCHNPRCEVGDMEQYPKCVEVGGFDPTNGNGWKYLRHIVWPNMRQYTVRKKDVSGRTGAPGGNQMSQVDDVFLSIIGRGSPAIEGLPVGCDILAIAAFSSKIDLPVSSSQPAHEDTAMPSNSLNLAACPANNHQ